MSSIHHLTKQEESPTRWDDLPEECWGLVFDRLKYHHHHDQYHHHDQNHHRHHRHRHRPYRHFESVSLVCKQFLSISNRLRSSLNIILWIPSKSSVLLRRRFPHLNRIDLVEFHGDLDLVLSQLAQSRLNHLQALDISKQIKFPEKGLKELGASSSSSSKSLKILICARLDYCLEDKDLMVIADALPYLEELDISYPKEEIYEEWYGMSHERNISDAGIVNLSSKLPCLRKINISGIHTTMFSSSLLKISSNCVFLTHITAGHYKFLTQVDIPSVIYINRHLISLTMQNTSSSLVSSSTARDLRVLDFSHMIISDEFLFSVSELDSPLKKLALSCCQGFTIHGIHSILCRHLSLKHLDLQASNFLTDQSVSDLSKYMHHLNFISLDSCSQLTNSTFFTLARNCPSLQEIRMEATSLGENDFLLPTDHEQLQNLAIRVLKFANNARLNDKTLEEIGRVCPKLESLDVSTCMGITEHGIHEIGKICSEIRELKIVGCKNICDFLVTHNSSSSEFSKLEDFNASSSGISDGGLSKLGCNCIGLQRLVLESCLEVTTEGVLEVVNKCKRLRELNLKNCNLTDDASLSLTKFLRLSLRKIFPPRGYITQVSKDFFLRRHGCMVVCDDH